jgi:4-carboxymuconolactone decarboxylase
MNQTNCANDINRKEQSVSLVACGQLRWWFCANDLPMTTNPSPIQPLKHNQTSFDCGLATRKQVMGEDFVSAAFANATAFTAPIQEHITRAAWGDVWQRPGLDKKTRSLITVAMLTALGKQHELKGHVRGALNNGATAAEIQEVLLHAAIYCGVPTAVEAFRTANEVVGGEI